MAFVAPGNRDRPFCTATNRAATRSHSSCWRSTERPQPLPLSPVRAPVTAPPQLSRSAAKNALPFCLLGNTVSRRAGAAGRPQGDLWGMLYQAYQAHSDIMVPVRSWATSALGAIGQPLSGFTDNAVLRNLTAAYELIARAGLTHQRPAYGIDRVTVGNREVAVREEAGARDAVRHAPALQEGHRHRATAGAAGGAAVGSFRDACCAGPCAPCCPSTMSTSPTGTMRATWR